MTAEQIAQIKALRQHVTFLPGSYDKRFVADLSGQANSNPDKPLTERQAIFLEKLCYKYRRQLNGMNK